MFETMEEFQETYPIVSEEILKIFESDGLTEYALKIKFIEVDDLINYQTMCGRNERNISQEAVDFLSDYNDVEFIIALINDNEAICSMFASLSCCEAFTFSYLVHEFGDASLRPDSFNTNEEFELVYFESE